MKNKNRIWIYHIFITGLFVIIISSCNKTGSFQSTKIGTQTWMKKNLNVDHFRNGDPISEVTNPSDWFNLTTGAWCYYENSTETGKIYGKLYNWYAVNDPRGLAPKGWHVASYKDWTILIDYVGGKNVAGGSLKEKGTNNWFGKNTNSKNKFGFTALPGGIWEFPGTFRHKGLGGYWWSSTSYSTEYDYAMYQGIFWNTSEMDGNNHSMSTGMSVRCVKD